MTRRLALVSGAVAVLMLVAFWFAAWTPTSHQLKAAHQRLSQAQTLQAQLRSQVTQLKSEQKQLGTYQQELRALQAAVPSTVSLDTIIDQLSTAAAASGVSLPSVSPSQSQSAVAASGPAKTRGSKLSTVSLNVNVQGSYNQVINFVNLLNSAPRLFVVDSISLTAASGAQSMAATLSIRAFYSGASPGSAS